MATSYVSPGVYVIEKDISEYAPTIDSSIVGVVGFATKGPTNEATLITSPEQLIRTFGLPSEYIPGQGLEGAFEILEATNNIYYVRGVSVSAATASALVPIGGCPAVYVTAGDYGINTPIYLAVEVKDNNGTSKTNGVKYYSVPSGTITPTDPSATQFLALRKVIGGSVDSDPVGVYAGDGIATTAAILAGSWAGSGATLSVSSYSDSLFTTPVAALARVTSAGAADISIVSAITVYGTTFKYTGASSVGYYTQALYAGAGYNAGIDSAGDTSGNSVEITTLGNSKFIIEINDSGAAIEQFKSDLVSSVIFPENVINIGDTNLKSNVIKAYLVSANVDFAATPTNDFIRKLSTLGVSNILGTIGGTGVTGPVDNHRFIKFVEGTYNLAGGDNGFSSNDDTNATVLIGDSATKTGIYALDDDVLNISIALVPGLGNQRLQNALITLAEQTQNFIALISPPYGSIDTVQEAIDWSNGKSETRDSAVNSSYAAVFWPWVKVFNVFDGVDRWYDPAIYGARQMAFTDSIADPWFAPAGFQRGRLTKPIDVDVILNQGDRDSMYSGGNVINPVVNFPQRGITIFGQRTTQRAATALDRINVRRLMIYLRKVLLAATQTFVFEPNDPITWENIQNVVDPVLDDIRRRRGITEYKVVCDETVNTPERIDRNELWCKILLKPTKTAEIIVFEINVTSSSAKLGS